MTTPFLRQPHGKGLAALMVFFSWTGLMFAAVLYVGDFSGLSGMILQTIMALSGALSLTIAWQLFLHSRVARPLIWGVVMLSVLIQVKAVLYLSRFGQTIDGWSFFMWGLQAAVACAVLGYVQFLCHKGVLH